MYKLDELTERERDAAWVDALETAQQFNGEATSCLDGQIYGAPVAWEIALCLAQRPIEKER